MVDGAKVSIMMPCYNARGSLPWALASVLSQTYSDWELVIVDDGSTDHPEDIVHQANDQRIRLIQLSANRGRGYARQVALDNSRGEFLCMLDADDWMYPNRIEDQVGLLTRNVHVSLVSSGLAIVNDSQHLVGIRSTGSDEVAGPFSGISCPVAHASSMFRAAAVGGTQYDDDLMMGEDVDFLGRLLQGQRYIVMDRALYAYGEPASVTAAKAASAMPYTRLRIRKQFASHPIDVARATAFSYGKEVVYRMASQLGLDDLALRRRNRLPSPLDLTAHEQARFRVAAIVMGRFSTPGETKEVIGVIAS